MAFALTSFAADGIRYQGPGPIRAVQQYVFTVTAAATDVDLDFGDATGTFWTAAQADATYGTMAGQVLDRIEDLVANYSGVKSIFLPEVFDRIQVASSPTGTQYSADLSTSLLLPDYTFAASGGETAFTLTVQYQMEPGILPNDFYYNVG